MADISNSMIYLIISQPGLMMTLARTRAMSKGVTPALILMLPAFAGTV
jgi:hypothetical protein